MQRPAVVNRRSNPITSNNIYIGRPSQWGNPFQIGRDGTREQVIAKYRDWIVTQPKLMGDLHTLAGKRLCCYCYPLPCHGDVLADLVEKL